MAESSDDGSWDRFRKLWDSEGPPESIAEAISHFLTIEESEQTYTQFQQTCIPGKQVLWSGMYREVAQDWANKHGMQTLTTAMGPLMDTSDPLCRRRHKNYDAWIMYIHGASAVFSWYIAEGDLITVLSQFPPQRFNPTGEAYYQTIEEPIIMGKLCRRHVGKILVVHPCVEGAQGFEYEMWPEDHSSSWIDIFGMIPWRYAWRHTNLTQAMLDLKAKLFPGEIAVASIPKRNIRSRKRGERKDKTTRVTKKKDIQAEREPSQSNPVNKLKGSGKKQKRTKQKRTEDKPKGDATSRNGRKSKAKKQPAKGAESKGARRKNV